MIGKERLSDWQYLSGGELEVGRGNGEQLIYKAVRSGVESSPSKEERTALEFWMCLAERKSTLM